MRCSDGITDSMDNECEQTLGNGEEQGWLVCCSPWGCKESDVTVTEQQLLRGIYFHSSFD